MQPLISIAICFMQNHLKYFNKLIKSIEYQNYSPLEVIIIDKSNSNIITEYVYNTNILLNIIVIKDNIPSGFSVNYNNAIKKSKGDYIFVLNPDTLLNSNCIIELLNTFQIDKRVGCVSPKILRMDENQKPIVPSIIDSTGLYLTPFLRHFDRGSEEIDIGQYNEFCYVFGVTGAAQCFSKECLENIKIQDKYFDEDFWSYREDADICWRLGNYGWKCVYNPNSILYHARTAKPNNRKNISPLINMHSVKNRYLLIINNISFTNYMLFLPFILFRDILVVMSVLFFERTSIDGLVYIIKNIKRLFRKRKIIKSKINRDISNYWFLHKAKKMNLSK